MKNLMGVMEGGSIPALSGLEDALKEQQKVSCSSSSSLSSLYTQALACNRDLYIWILVFGYISGSTWNREEEEKGGIEKEICGVSIKQARSSWVWVW